MTSLTQRWRRFAAGFEPEPGAQFVEPGDYRVILQTLGPDRVKTIREVRRTTGLSLLGAKLMTDRVPITVASRISERSAGLVVDQLVSVGAQAVLQEDGLS